MCTAITLESDGYYFGRTLDLEFSYEERVTVIPRNFVFQFREMKKIEKHFAIIGMATVKNGFPLLYDATNEWGLSIAGLNFPDNACYCEKSLDKPNVASFELIPLILGKCKTVDEAVRLIEGINITADDFDENLRSAPLHWIIADSASAVTVEPTREGVKIFDNNVGVLTNNPPFLYHITNLNNYMGISALPPENRFSDRLKFSKYSRGMGGMGLPGDNSSASRFVRAAFLKYNALPHDGDGVGLFFRIMSGIEQTKGTVRLENGKNVISVYTSCCDIKKGIYYYKTYRGGFGAVDMKREDLDGDRLSTFELIAQPHITWQN